MSAPIIFPDGEKVLCNYLRSALATYGYPNMFVSNRREKQTTAVWVRRDGGPRLDQVRESQRFGVNVFAESEEAAADLARTVQALIIAAPNGAPILRVTTNSGPSPVADAGAKARRFMSFDVDVRGVELTA